MSDTLPRPVDPYSGRTGPGPASLVGVYRTYETLPNGTTVQVMPSDDEEIRPGRALPEEVEVCEAPPDDARVCIGHATYPGAANLPLRFGDGICPVCVLAALEAGQITLRNAEVIATVLGALPETQVIEFADPTGGTSTYHQDNFRLRGLLRRLLATHERRFENAARIVDDARRWRGRP